MATTEKRTCDECSKPIECVKGAEYTHLQLRPHVVTDEAKGWDHENHQTFDLCGGCAKSLLGPLLQALVPPPAAVAAATGVKVEAV